MTPAQSNLAAYAAWLQANRCARPTPLAGPTTVGRFAVIVPSDLDAAPMGGFGRAAMPLFVPRSQAVGVDTGPIVMDAPDRLDRLAARLTHLLWKMKALTLPPCRMVGLDDGRLTLTDVMERKGIADADLASTLILFTPLWGLSAFDRATVLSKFAVH